MTRAGGFLLVGLLLLAGAARAQAPMPDVRFDQRRGERLPLDAGFVDENGAQVQLGDYFGKRPAIVALVYYECPMLCTLVLNGMVRSLNAVPFTAGKDFDVIAISIDPGETPELATAKKQSYLARYRPRGTERGWHFLTGKERDIRRVADAMGYRYQYLPDKDQYAHPAGIVVATPQGRLTRYLYGVDYPARDLKFALMDASGERIGSPVDQLLLLCFCYDPTTGRYGFAILSALRLGGLLTVLGIGAFVWRMLRRQKRRAPEAAAP